MWTKSELSQVINFASSSNSEAQATSVYARSKPHQVNTVRTDVPILTEFVPRADEGCARSRDAATPRGVRKSTRGNAFRRTQHPHSPWSPASATRVSRTSHVPILTEFVPRADVRGIGMPRLPVAYAWREEGCARAGGAGAIAPAVCASVRAMWAPQIFNCFSLASLRQSRRDSW